MTRVDEDPARAGAPRPSPLLEAVSILAGWRRVVIGFTAGAVLVALLYALVARSTYTARASLLPRQEEGDLAGISALVSNQLGAFAGSIAGMTSSTDVLMTILESRNLRERLIERLDLVPALGIRAKSPERARETALARLERMTRLGLTKRLSIFVEVKAPTAELAAKIANGYFSELDRLNQELAFTSARQTRVFVERRLAETRDSLAVCQARLEEFQRANRMVAIDEQARAAVEVASRLQGELIGLEAQLEVQKRYSTGAYSRTRDLEFRIAALRGRLATLAGTGEPAGADGGDPLSISFSQIPGLGRRLADLMLEVKTQQAVFTLLTTQYQQSKIDEARDIPTIQVLDEASPPVFRSAPRRRSLVVGGLVGGLGAGVLLAFAFEYLGRALAGPSGLTLRRRLGAPADRLADWLERARG